MRNRKLIDYTLQCYTMVRIFKVITALKLPDIWFQLPGDQGEMTGKRRGQGLNFCAGAYQVPEQHLPTPFTLSLLRTILSIVSPFLMFQHTDDTINGQYDYIFLLLEHRCQVFVECKIRRLAKTCKFVRRCWEYLFIEICSILKLLDVVWVHDTFKVSVELFALF